MFRLTAAALLAAVLAAPAAAQDTSDLFGALQDALDSAGEGGGSGGGGSTADTNANTGGGGGGGAMPAASGGPVNPEDPASLVRAMQNAGFRAELAVDNIGYPMVRSSTQGINYAIFFYGCRDDGTECTNVQFEATFTMNSPLTAESMNAFNSAKRFIRVVVNDQGNPAIRMDVNMTGGVSEDYFLDMINLWDILVGDFLVHIDW